jgi:hypothetical protein
MGKGVARKDWPDGSVGELAQYVAPRVFANERCPAWPPDVFAVAGTLLQRTGAYVRDVERGEREIELGAGEDACIVSVVCESKNEFTADGRGNARAAHFPVLAGVHPLSLRSAAAKAR